jgi:hypothetical protein
MTKAEKKAYDKAYYIKNKEKKALQMKAWRTANPEKDAKIKQEWAEANREKCRKVKSEWAKRNPGTINAKTARHRAKKLKATPNWLTPEDHQYIAFMYRKAAELTKMTGICHEVDHIHPLQGRNISGLHCPLNLQILTKDKL